MLKDVWSVIQTCNLPSGRTPRGLIKWLLIVRPCVMSMTATSVLIGALLAWDRGYVRVDLTLLVLLGLLLAHAVNNMANDLIDAKEGVDTPEYPRASYAPHPILDGLVSERELLLAILVANGLDVLIAVYLTLVRGWPILAFALAGAFLSLGYVAPPLSFKRRGLGELVALIVWGPLMIGGTYYAIAGHIDARVWLASLPYGLMVAVVLMGKHLDKYDIDRRKGIRTLPVLLGFERARRWTMALMIAIYPLVLLLVLLKALPVGTLLVFLSIPRLITVLRMYNEPKPQNPPPDWPVWPLWYVAIAMWLNRLVGGLFLLGLVLDLVLDLVV